MSRRSHRLPRGVGWLLVLLLVVLFLGHPVLVRYVSVRMGFPAISLTAVVVGVLILHSGLLASAYAAFRRRRNGPGGST